MTSDVAEVSGHTVSGVPGRFILDARENHLVSDSRFGPAEAVQAGELLLAAIVSCAMANIQSNAEADEIGVEHIEVHASHRRGAADPTRYDFTEVRIEIHGVDQPTADSLAAKFAASCPIYNTIRRGSGIALTVTAHSDGAGGSE
ncbi:redox protein [Rhodococcus sp. SC4]|uniref:OsmC family protein n=1 Tax=Rhodococcus sp. ACPA1 TaxID=2028572 RepID=UPI00076A7049|nr:OsmC family protein [Rhodococcus sp. ACPA1]KXF55166.1 redox protein [Rhodococcus sp. SC4]PBC53801.1 redox protein [Rhodococcus sp. ACPA1]